ncbi:MAG: ribonuclease P protein component 4 [Candidatus Micrarchaeaceae archaeon]
MPKDHKQLVSGIAKQRIAILYGLAKEAATKNTPEELALSRSYTTKIKLISMHYKVKLPKEIKNSICKKCGSLLIPGLSAQVRIASANHYAIWKCSSCGTEKHIPYGPKA